MATIEQAKSADLSGYSPVSPVGSSGSSAASPPSVDLQPGLNSMLRCPLPPISQASPDSLRQFYQGGTVPQTRLLTPVSSTSAASGGVQSKGVIVTNVTNVTGSSSAPYIPVLPGEQAVSLTAVLGPGQTYRGSFAVCKAFQVLGISLSGPARVVLYGTAQAQTQDAYRGIDIPPAAGTAQNIIFDVVLDTAPYQWSFQSRVGANSDSPQKPIGYVSVTNLVQSSVTLTLTMQYLQLEGS